MNKFIKKILIIAMMISTILSAHSYVLHSDFTEMPGFIPSQGTIPSGFIVYQQKNGQYWFGNQEAGPLRMVNITPQVGLSVPPTTPPSFHQEHELQSYVSQIESNVPLSELSTKDMVAPEKVLSVPLQQIEEDPLLQILKKESNLLERKEKENDTRQKLRSLIETTQLKGPSSQTKPEPIKTEAKNEISTASNTTLTVEITKEKIPESTKETASDSKSDEITATIPKQDEVPAPNKPIVDNTYLLYLLALGLSFAADMLL